MNERLVSIPIPAVFPGASAALGALYGYLTIPFDCTLVYVCAATDTDDAALTLDINDDGTAIVTAIDAADASVPGEWISTHFGGAETPVNIAAGSVLSFDANSAANTNVLFGYLLVLTSDVYA